MPRTGTPVVIGFLPASQRPLNEYYLNEGVAWADTTEALAGIPIGSRSDGLTIKIGLVEYWFKADLTTLEIKTTPVSAIASDVSIGDLAGIYDAENVEDALAEIMGYAISIAESIPSPESIQQNIFRISFGAYSSVAARVASATEITDYPAGWVLSAVSSYNLQIVHTLTTRKIVDVKVWEIDTDERILRTFSEAYTGIVSSGTDTVIIEGLAPTLLAIRIELIFN